MQSPDQLVKIAKKFPFEFLIHNNNTILLILFYLYNMLDNEFLYPDPHCKKK